MPACRRSGSLPSAGITRPLRYYGPIRHLAQPALTLAGSPLISRLPAVVAGTDLPCCTPIFCHTCCHLYPGKTVRGGPRSLAGRRRPARSTGGRLSHLILSRPCWCSLVLRPLWPADPQRDLFPKCVRPSSPPDPPRVLPAGARVAGWGLHPRRQCALERHTMEPHRASPVRLHHPELARQAVADASGDRATDRQHHDYKGSECPVLTRREVTGAKAWAGAQFSLAPIRLHGFFASCAAAIVPVRY